MKRTPKLNTVEIADKLNELAADAAMIALAAEGLFKRYGNRGTSRMVRRTYAMHDELSDLSHGPLELPQHLSMSASGQLEPLPCFLVIQSPVANP